MSNVEAAQAQLREIVREMAAIRYRLLGVLASLPLSPSETDPHLEVDPTDPVARLRGTIDCLLDDCIVPALRNLPGTAGDPAEPEGGQA